MSSTSSGAAAATSATLAGEDLCVMMARAPAEFGDVWPRMADRGDFAAYVFQRRDWLEGWMATIGAARNIEPIFVRVDRASGEPLMLLAFGLQRRWGVRILSFMDEGLSDYNAPVLFPGAEQLDAAMMGGLWRTFCACLPPLDVALLDKIPATVEAAANPLCLLPCKPRQSSGHLVDFPGGYDPSKYSLRRDSGRKKRRLNEIAPLRFVIASTPAEFDFFLATMMRQKTRRYIETRGVDGFAQPGCRAYFDVMTSRFAPSGEVHLAALLVGDEAVASHWGIVCGDRYYSLMPAYEAGRWAVYSPGRLLIEDLVAWAQGAGFRIFDMGVGDEPYKAKFENVVLPLFEAAIPAPVAGRAFLALSGARQALSDGPLGEAYRAMKRRRGAAKVEQAA